MATDGTTSVGAPSVCVVRNIFLIVLGCALVGGGGWLANMPNLGGGVAALVVDAAFDRIGRENMLR